MSVEELLQVECGEVSNYISMSDIIALNVKITAPEKIEELIEFEENGEEIMETMIESPQKSKFYSDGHENDDFGIQQIENLENLLETEFYYICQENNDLIYLSAVLMHRIAIGHPFEEGNKRTAYLAACIFLMTYQVYHLDSQTVAFPDLDKDLLNTLEDIAKKSPDISPEELCKVYREDLVKEIKKINLDQ